MSMLICIISNIEIDFTYVLLRKQLTAIFEIQFPEMKK